MQVKMAQAIENKVEKLDSKESKQGDAHLKEIMEGLESQLFGITNINKNLEFRNYILEKRLADEALLHRKQMAKEIFLWK